MRLGTRKSFGRGAPLQLQLEPMTQDDLGTVLQIIDGHDDEDAEDAEQSYASQGLDGQFVYRRDGAVIGVSGYRPIVPSDRSAWLSWTYLEKSLCGQGLGRKMMEAMLAELNRLEVRMVFVSTSDYVDPDEGPIYAAALALYQSLGFELQITCSDYYASGEAQLLLGLRLKPRQDEVNIDDQTEPVKFCQMDEIVETEGAYYFGWEVAGKQPFTAADVEIGLSAMRSKLDARLAVTTFPGNMPLIEQPLLQAGFRETGRLIDFFEDGVDERHFVYYL